MGQREIAEFLQISQQRVSQLSRTKNFPKPIAILSGRKIWEYNKIKKWAEIYWNRTKGRPKKI